MDMDKYCRLVIELYKQCFAEYICNHTIDVGSILEAQSVIANALTKARIENGDVQGLLALQQDVEHLKYHLL